MKTRSGSFPIGFRVPGGEWTRDIGAVTSWAQKAGFECLELPGATPAAVATAVKAGLKVSSIDFAGIWSTLLSKNNATRKEAVALGISQMTTYVEKGVRNFLTIGIPEDPSTPPREIYNSAVESYGTLGAEAEKLGAKIIFEGWPGGGLHPNLFCNPESCRALFKDAGSAALGINYDPSHLIRMGIDHVRFADEFASRIFHVHGKDTEIFGEEVYEVGRYQTSIFKKSHGYGTTVWRYTIPGQGEARWGHIFKILQKAGYKGAVSIEMEDENFHGDEGVKEGLLASLHFLQSA